MKSLISIAAALSLFAAAAQATTCTIPTTGKDDTSAIQSAFKSCATGGTVVFTKGSTYYLNAMISLTGLQGTTVQFDGTLNLPVYASSYENGAAYISVTGDSVKWTGTGTIVGNGQAWYDKKLTDAPRVLAIHTTNSVFSGFKITQAPRAHFSVNAAKNTVLENLTINTVSTSSNPAKNTDAFDVSSSSGIVIRGSNINNGDDCLAVNSGVTNLTFTNNNCVGSHGFSIGSLGKDLSTGTVDGVNITTNSCTNCQNGVRIKTWPGGQGYVKNIIFNNINLQNVDNPILITTHYCDSEHQSSCNADDSSSLSISAVNINNVYGTVSTAGHPVLSVNCSTKTPCSNFAITNINVAKASKTPKNVCIDLTGSSSIPYCSQ
ncbi:pectin lyase fold/virulence factor [Umbelopsis sp. AD052]|nr:pectin lyase fold/virulence factor [Umbelopsis sp. AD052]